ncbi:hypothetical protein JB92DRAFT_2916075 [Gautieria morchelliformis]|nr:hypothetical protein JB92DRAFT_2916075 [Gautieria morchelliformis]
MAHSFVVTRFIPQRSAWWTSYYGVQKASALVTHPFLALRVFATDLGWGDPSNPTRHIYLFIVSPQKPTGLNSDCYFTVASTVSEETRHLRVHPPLTRDGPTLYIHTFPKLYEEESSFRIFCRSVMKDHSRRMRLQRLETIRTSSPHDADKVQSDWDTWSGQLDEEYLHEPGGLVYEHLPFNNLPLQEPCSIHQELLLYKQFTADYSWSGVTAAISWVRELRDRMAKEGLPQAKLVDSGPYSGSRAEPSIRATMEALQSMNIPYDGDPPPAAEAEEEPEWEWDDPCPASEMVPISSDTVGSADVKVIVFDLIGTILDRETAVREALQSIIQADWTDLTPRQLVAVYMECEALQSKHQPGAAYVDIARSAFKDVGMRLGFNISEGALDQSIQCLMQPHLYPDGFPAIAALHARGYKILGFSSLDAHTFTQYFQRSVPPEVTIVQPSPTSTPLYSPNLQVFPDLLSHCRCGDEEIQKAQVLVVTAAPYRTAEPASTSGFPTALIKRAGGLESNVNINTAAPTVVIDGLSHLCKVLESVPLSPPETAFSRVQRFRVNGLYQSTEPIGSGSFGEGNCIPV